MVPAIPHEDVAPVGSFDAYGTGADKDYVVLVENQDAAADQLIRAGWNYDSTYGDSFRSVRQGEVNFILTHSRILFQSYKHAALAMRQLAAIIPRSDKAFRIALYDLVKQANRIKIVRAAE
jgi:hypothetical protein